MSKYLSDFERICKTLIAFDKKSIPLCAAETPMSPFSKVALDSNLQEKYIMGGVRSFGRENNFVEAKYLFQIYQLINAQCKDLFHCEYADPRSLSGVNAVMVLLMSLFKEGDTILISSEDSGGHSSMPLICKRLGIKTIELPFDYQTLDFDYDSINRILAENRIQGILVCPSDLLWQPHLERIQLPPGCCLIYDATQTLGLIANGVNDNPLDKFSKDDLFILMGATHKTIPGPTSGLIMTKNLSLANRFDQKINPDFLRNVQFHHILSLSLVLMELEVFGESYGKETVKNANVLGKYLEGNGFSVIKREPFHYTETHQLFIPLPPNTLDHFMRQCTDLGISLNARFKKLYRGAGIRIGVQAVTRYGWSEKELFEIADILTAIRIGKSNVEFLAKRVENLSKHKEIHYTFTDETLEQIHTILHDS